jgi:hypothetical protein
MSDHIKLADFGSCKGVYSRHPYTEYAIEMQHLGTSQLVGTEPPSAY